MTLINADRLLHRTPNETATSYGVPLGRSDGTIDINWIRAGDITGAKIGTGEITGSNIANATITNANIVDATIENAKIANSTLTGAKIASATITGSNIASATVATANIVASAITTALINDAAITRTKIGAAAVGTAEIETGAITGALLANAAVGTINIENLAITGALIASGAVGEINIANAAITPALINDSVKSVYSTVFSPKISYEFKNSSESFTVTGATIANNDDSITLTSTGTDPILRTPVISLDGSLYSIIQIRIKRTGGSGWDGRVFYTTGGHGETGFYYKAFSEPGSFTEYQVIELDMSDLTAGGTDWITNTITKIRFDFGATASDVFEIDFIAVGKRGAFLEPGTVDTTYIADAAITTAKIANAQITNALIGNLAVQTAHIDNLAVTTGKIALLAVDTAQIANVAVTNGKIGLLAVDTAQIAAAAITTAKIGDAQVTNAKIDTLDVSKLTAGTITSKAITLAVGTGDVKIQAGKTDFGQNTTAGFILGMDDSDSDAPKLELCDGTNYLNLDSQGISSRGLKVQAGVFMTKGSYLTAAPSGHVANSFSANQMSVETDTTGFTQVSGTMSRSSEQAFIGAYSLKIISPAAFSVLIDGSTTYGSTTKCWPLAYGNTKTLSVWVYGDGSINTAFNIYEFNTIGDNLGIYPHNAGVRSAEWIKETLVYTPVNGSCVGIKIYLVATNVGTAYFDYMQWLTGNDPQNILYVKDTSDFAAYGSGWFIDTTNDRDEFFYESKTATTLVGCYGVLSHNNGATVVPAVENMVIDDAVNEMRFFGNNGSGTFEELISLGIKQDGADYFIGYFGSPTAGNSRVGIRGESNSSIGVSGKSSSGTGVAGNSSSGYAVYGNSVSSVGVAGNSSNSYGLYGNFAIATAKGPIRLQPSSSASAPTHAADKGALWVTSAGILYINTDDSTTWAKVGAQ